MVAQGFKDLLLQTLETEIGGVQLYATALYCAADPDLRSAYERHLDRAQRGVAALLDMCTQFGVDPDEETPRRSKVRRMGESMVYTLALALRRGDRKAMREVIDGSAVVVRPLEPETASAA